MNPDATALRMIESSMSEDHYKGEFWYMDQKYDIEVLGYDDSVLVIADDGENGKQSAMINEYSIVEESGSTPTSPYRIDQSLERHLTVWDGPAEITEENMEKEIEAYVIQTLRPEEPEEIRSNISAQEYLNNTR